MVVIFRYRNGTAVVESSNLSIKTDKKAGSSMLAIAKAKAGVDDGVYACHLDNESGHASVETTVVIASTTKVRIRK